MRNDANIELRSIQVRTLLMLLAVSVVIRSSYAIQGIVSPRVAGYFALAADNISILFFVSSTLGWIFQIPLGLLIDRWGCRRIILGFLFVLAVVFTGAYFFLNIITLAILFFAVGIAQAAFIPVMFKALAGWYPLRFRGRLLCSFLVAPVLVMLPLNMLWMFVADFLDWKVLFGVCGLLAFICAIGSYIFLRDRSEILLMQERELSLDNGMPQEDTASGVLRGFLRILASSSAWGVIAASIAIGFLVESQQTWISSTLRSAGHGFFLIRSEERMISTIITACGLVGMIVGSIALDRVVMRLGFLRFVRIMVLASLGGVFVFWLVARYVGNIYLFVVFAGIGSFLLKAGQISLWGLVLSIIPSRYCGTFAAIQNVALSLGSSCATAVLVLHQNSYLLLSVAVITAFMAAALFFWLVRKPIIGTRVQGLETLFS